MRSYYQKISAQDEEKSQDNEIRVRARGILQSYVNRAATLLLQDKPFDEIIIQGIDKAIPHCFIISEIIRQRIKNLYSVISIKTRKITETFEPVYKDIGLKVIVQQKDLAILEIKITKKPTDDDKKNPGFQDKLLDAQVQERSLSQIIKRRDERSNLDDRGRGRGRGMRGRGMRGRGRGQFRRYNRDYNEQRRDNRDYNEQRRDNRDYNEQRRDNRDYNEQRRYNRDYNEQRRDNRDYNEQRRDNSNQRNQYVDRRQNNEYRANRQDDEYQAKKPTRGGVKSDKQL